ncbi:neprilysin-1-like [Ornithodoros turicata]|uniref:neprilysin-1-like n=1 Tax=Ornithodoros turicata TaxID=34597 RepID=UPI0031386E34
MLLPQPVHTSSEPIFDRHREYKLFLCSIVLVTFTITLALPVLLYRYLAQCSEPQCYTVALEVRRSIEASASPCHDFFQYTCGSIKSSIVDKVQSGLRKSTIRWLSTVPVTARQNALQKLGIILRNCIKLSNRKPESVEKIQMVLNASALPFPQMPPVNMLRVTKSLVTLNLEWGIAVFFRLTVGQNLQRKGEHIFYVLPNEDLNRWVAFLDALEEDRNLDVYVRRCAEIIGDQGMSYSRLVEAMRLVNQEARLALRTGSRGQVAFVPFYTRAVMWSHVFAVLSKEFFSQPNVSRELFVVDTEHFEALSATLFEKTDPAALYAYIGLYVVWHLARYASHPLAYSSTVPGYEYKLTDIWRQCFSDAYRFMPHALLYVHAERHFSIDDIIDIEDMLGHVTRVTIRILRYLSEKKEINTTKLTDKVDSLRLFLFRPPHLTHLEDLNRLYSYLPDQKDEDYVDTFLSASRRTAQYVRSLLHYGVRNQSSVFLPPFVVRLPYMVPVYNLVELPPSFLMPPVYTFHQSLSLNYAGLGHGMSLEVSKMVFGDHRLLNGSGRYEAVWSPGFRHELQRKVQCLRKQFLAYSWDESDLEPTSIQLALAMHIAFQAFTEAMKQPSASDRLMAERRHFSMTPQQLFFVGSCIKWCQAEEQQNVQQKCRFPLLVLQAFSRAFGCTKRDPMTSHEHCFFLPDSSS